MANTPWRRASILLDVDAGVRHSESSTVPSAPGAGYGMFWVRDDATTVPMFTDSIGGDTVLGTGGAPDRIAQSGVITEGLEFFIDFNNQSSWEPNQTTTWVDTIASDSGATTSTTIVDGHLNFNGTQFGGTSKVTFGNLSTELADAFAGGGCAMAWIRVESDGETNFGRIIDAGWSTGNYTLYVLGESGGRVQLGFGHVFTGVDGNWTTLGVEIRLNEWCHVAVVYDSDLTTNDAVFYVNGVSKAVTETGTPTLVPSTSTSLPMVVGNDSASGSTFDGDIEVVGVYSTTKTAAEIVDIYNTQRERFGITPADRIATAGVITEDLQFFIDFNNQSSWIPNQAMSVPDPTWTDTIADMDGIVSNATVVEGHLNFNNTTTLANFGTLPPELTDLWAGGGTMQAWIRPETAGEGNFGRIYDTGENGNKGTLCLVTDLSGGLMKFGFWLRVSGAWGTWYTVARVVVQNAWNHVAITFDSDSLTTLPLMYINGVATLAVSSGSTTGPIATDAGSSLTVGNTSLGSGTFDGDIEMLGLYNETKTVAEIVDTFNATKTRFGVEGDVVAPDRIATAGVITETLQFFVDFNNQSSWTPNQAMSVPDPTWTDTIADLAGTVANGTVVEGHLNFNALTTVANFGVLPTALENLFLGGGTMMGWIRAGSDGEGDNGRIVDTIDGGGFTDGWTAQLSFESAGLIKLTLAQRYAAGYSTFTETVASVPINVWTHVAIVFDSTLSTNPCLMYINGVSVAVTPGIAHAGAPITDQGNSLRIGNNQTSALTFDGDIEMIGLYDSELTAAEVADTFNATKTRFGVSGGSGQLGAAVEDTGATNPALMDATFAWRITDNDVLSFNDSSGARLLLSLAPTAAGDTITLGNGTGTAPFVVNSGSSGVSLSSADGNATGGPILLATGNGTTSGGSINLTAGEGITAGAGGSIAFVGGAGAGAGLGGSITLTPGDSASGAHSAVTIAGAQAETEPMLVFDSTGTAGNVEFYTGASLPTASAPSGSFYLRQDTASSTIYVNTSAVSPGVTWTAVGGSAPVNSVSTLVQTDQTLTTGSLALSGGTIDLDITSFIDEGQIFDLQVTRTAGTGGDDIDVEIFTEDAFTNRVYFAEAADASTAFRDSSGIYYEDLDASQELHIRVTNQSAAAATFDVRARGQGEGLLALNILSFTTVKTLTYTGSVWEYIKYDPTGGTFQLNFPPSPSIGDRMGTKNAGTSTITITVSGNGNNLEDPGTPGTTAASVTEGGVGGDYQVWQYDGTVWWIV